MTPAEPSIQTETDGATMDTGLTQHELVQLSERLDTRVIITEQVLSQFLASGNLSLDDDGFIIDAESGTFVEPYAYDRSLFHKSNTPAENVFKEYFAPAETVLDNPINNKETVTEKLHVSRLHGLISVGTESESQKHPVADVADNLTKFISDTGIAFENVTEWSTAKSLVKAETTIRLTRTNTSG